MVFDSGDFGYHEDHDNAHPSSNKISYAMLLTTTDGKRTAHNVKDPLLNQCSYHLHGEDRYPHAMQLSLADGTVRFVSISERDCFVWLRALSDTCCL